MKVRGAPNGVAAGGGLIAVNRPAETTAANWVLNAACTFARLKMLKPSAKSESL